MGAFQSSQVTVGTSPTVLVSGLEGRYQIVLSTPEESGAPVIIGQSTVAWSAGNPNGFVIGGNEANTGILVLDVNLDSTDTLYAVASASTVPIHVLVSPR